MIQVFEKILSFIKESAKTFFIAGGTCVALIFFSDQLGTESIRDAVNPLLKVILIICTLGLLYILGQAIYSVSLSQVKSVRIKAHQLKRLKDLTGHEKSILNAFFIEGVRSKSLDSNDGNVVELERIGIIFPSTNYMDWGSHCKYNVSDWAWEYIKKNPEVLM